MASTFEITQQEREALANLAWKLSNAVHYGRDEQDCHPEQIQRLDTLLQQIMHYDRSMPLQIGFAFVDIKNEDVTYVYCGHDSNGVKIAFLEQNDSQDPHYVSCDGYMTYYRFAMSGVDLRPPFFEAYQQHLNDLNTPPQNAPQKIREYWQYLGLEAREAVIVTLLERK